MLDKERPFQVLKRALADIEAEGATEAETDEDRQWMDALRTATAGEPGFGTLTIDEMEAIADSTPGFAFNTDRASRTQQFLRSQNVVGGTVGKASAAVPAVSAAIFRRDGTSNSTDQNRAQRTLERLRRRLDEEDDPQR